MPNRLSQSYQLRRAAQYCHEGMDALKAITNEYHEADDKEELVRLATLGKRCGMTAMSRIRC